MARHLHKKDFPVGQVRRYLEPGPIVLVSSRWRAMAARAECVMLNKGPYLLEAIDELDTLLGRMEENQHKKTPQLRRLRSW